jgi:hypothetical protein
MKKFEQSQEKTKKSFIKSKTMKVIAGTALSTSLLGAGAEIASAGEVSTQSSAAVISQALNEQQVARNVVVEQGYQIPLKYNHNSTNPVPVSILNPIKLGKDTYGYFSDNPKAGHIVLHTIKYDKPLEVSLPGKDFQTSREYVEEVITPISVVYSVFNSAAGQNGEYRFITFGDHPGNENGLVRFTPGSNSTIRGDEVNEEIAAIQYVGALDWYTPVGAEG